MGEEKPIYTKKAIETDLALIKTCLKLLNQSIYVSIKEGETYEFDENENLHESITKIDHVLGSIKQKIGWEK